MRAVLTPVLVIALVLLAMSVRPHAAFTLVGLTPAQVEDAIGRPDDRRDLADSDESYWSYSTRYGTLSVHFENGLVVSIAPDDFPVEKILEPRSIIDAMAALLPSDARVVAAEGRQLSTNLSGEIVILSLHDGVYYGLKDVGARVWALLETPRRVDDIVNRIVAEFDVVPAVAEADIQELLGDLADHQLIRIDVPDRA